MCAGPLGAHGKTPTNHDGLSDPWNCKENNARLEKTSSSHVQHPCTAAQDRAASCPEPKGCRAAGPQGGSIDCSEAQA